MKKLDLDKIVTIDRYKKLTIILMKKDYVDLI